MKKAIIALAVAVSAAAVVFVVVSATGKKKPEAPPQDFLATLKPAARTLPAQGEIVLDDGTFSVGYAEIHDFRDEFYGRGIAFSGVVMVVDGLKPGEFLVGRNVSGCCEEDAYFTGFLAYSAGAVPAAGDKIAVSGALEAREYRSAESGRTMTLPAIRIEAIRPDPTVKAFVPQSF